MGAGGLERSPSSALAERSDLCILRSRSFDYGNISLVCGRILFILHKIIMVIVRLLWIQGLLLTEK